MKTYAKPLFLAFLFVGMVGIGASLSAMPLAGGPVGGLGNQFGPTPLLAGKAQDLLRLAHQLGITEEQREEFWSIRTSYMDEVEALRGALLANRGHLVQLVMEPGFDEEVVRRIADEQSELIVEMIVLRARQGSEMISVLNDEQLSRLESLYQSREL
jgi:Spy/CpxP family protein refolding chaperone